MNKYYMTRYLVGDREFSVILSSMGCNDKKHDGRFYTKLTSAIEATHGNDEIVINPEYGNSLLDAKHKTVIFLLNNEIPWLLEKTTSLTPDIYSKVISTIVDEISSSKKSNGLYTLCKQIYKDLYKSNTFVFPDDIKPVYVAIWYFKKRDRYGTVLKRPAPLIRCFNTHDGFTQIDPTIYKEMSKVFPWLSPYKKNRVAYYCTDERQIKFYNFDLI